MGKSRKQQQTHKISKIFISEVVREIYWKKISQIFLHIARAEKNMRYSKQIGTLLLKIQGGKK
ncbi:hypothetical protein AR437_04180 [Christensenella hongkongensis]|uniref:Uncharacterized protein n=1 Tax=Christensenella hongkongensis TaxID=270498 RepID=A0A0M2NG21_9FIRM|nr:hypothetical protein CHK_2527 [Christensenella hongkongensis]KUJ31919.1 hypothetical protein AR437_04180 [Christensenella hongkongensis]